MSKHRFPDPPREEDFRTVREFIEAAREHHARTGEWPPDPLLDELNEMRRRVEAEHGPDPRKVLEWYIQAGKRQAALNGSASEAGTGEHSAPASGR
jgi:hypothetical protein